MKTSIIIPLLAFLTSTILADTPPACLLNAVNTQDSPSNLTAVCGKEATDVQQAIASLCSGSAVSVAQSAFISTCSVAGTSVAPYTTKPTSNATSATSGASVTAGVATASRSPSPSGTSASASGNAASEKKQVGSFAAAVIAIAGVVAVL